MTLRKKITAIIFITSTTILSAALMVFLVKEVGIWIFLKSLGFTLLLFTALLSGRLLTRETEEKTM